MIVAVCGARYAADQFEGIAEISETGADLLAGGGVIGRMRARNERISAPTRVAPIGLLADASGRRLNLARYAAETRSGLHDIATLCVAGAGMNSGKTMIMAALAHGLSRAGHRVAALKLTGTGAFGDWNAYADAGAAHVAVFLDAGFASTYSVGTDRILCAFDTLKSGAAEAGCNVILVELADGLLQKPPRFLENRGSAMPATASSSPPRTPCLHWVGWAGLPGKASRLLRYPARLPVHRLPLPKRAMPQVATCWPVTRSAIPRSRRPCWRTRRNA